MPSKNTSKKRRVTIELSKANAELAVQAAKILKLTLPKVISLCLTGSTNP